MIAHTNPGADIIDRLIKVFGWIEERDLRVGQLWLNPKQIEQLNESHHAGWDKVASYHVREETRKLKGAPLVGFFLGAEVYESETVVAEHVVALPSGLDVKLLDGTGAMPF
jgi:hypothetical protein